MVSLKSKSLFPIFHVLVLAWSGAAVSSGFTVRSLPGFKGPLPFHLETGYVGVGEGGDVQLFYYFIHSERNPKEDPLVLWLVGGPRCTALHGITYEIGPLYFKAADSNGSLPNLVLNPDSWTQVANVIFLDAPVGTGFSYWRTAERFLISDTISARHTNQFLQNWLTDHPQFLSNPLYIGGDSYSGIVIPVIVEELINGIEAGKEPQFNFKGYFLGNPLTSPYLENDAQIPFAHRMGLISEELYEMYGYMLSEEWANDERVRKALHIREGTIEEWVRCDRDSPYEFDIRVRTTIEYHRNISSRGYRSLIYSGDHDMIVPHISTESWIRSLNLSIADDWHPWFVNREIAGEEVTLLQSTSLRSALPCLRGG
ncbi:hypothetical protein IFM89_030743 [Coptis chinensis]|uniref:Uncharacterized protein n=1 Tax=Coptis chinensis TaxID=261450 RepID=A0A835IVT6_9MAGN|nr:hypothetical protein IFM89_030743 [Coptis chinensis]